MPPRKNPTRKEKIFTYVNGLKKAFKLVGYNERRAEEQKKLMVDWNFYQQKLIKATKKKVPSDYHQSLLCFDESRSGRVFELSWKWILKTLRCCKMENIFSVDVWSLIIWCASFYKILSSRSQLLFLEKFVLFSLLIKPMFLRTLNLLSDSMNHKTTKKKYDVNIKLIENLLWYRE